MPAQTPAPPPEQANGNNVNASYGAGYEAGRSECSRISNNNSAYSYDEGYNAGYEAGFQAGYWATGALKDPQNPQPPGEKARPSALIGNPSLTSAGYDSLILLYKKYVLFLFFPR